MNTSPEEFFEGSAVHYDVTLTAPDGTDAPPDSATVAVVSRTTGASIRTATDQAVDGSTLHVVVTSDENALAAGARMEIRRVIVTAVYGDADDFVTVRDYLLRSPRLAC